MNENIHNKESTASPKCVCVGRGLDQNFLKRESQSPRREGSGAD